MRCWVRESKTQLPRKRKTTITKNGFQKTSRAATMFDKLSRTGCLANRKICCKPESSTGREQEESRLWKQYQSDQYSKPRSRRHTYYAPNRPKKPQRPHHPPSTSNNLSRIIQHSCTTTSPCSNLITFKCQTILTYPTKPWYSWTEYPSYKTAFLEKNIITKPSESSYLFHNSWKIIPAWFYLEEVSIPTTFLRRNLDNIQGIVKLASSITSRVPSIRVSLGKIYIAR